MGLCGCVTMRMIVDTCMRVWVWSPVLVHTSTTIDPYAVGYTRPHVDTASYIPPCSTCLWSSFIPQRHLFFSQYLRSVPLFAGVAPYPPYNDCVYPRLHTQGTKHHHGVLPLELECLKKLSVNCGAVPHMAMANVNTFGALGSSPLSVNAWARSWYRLAYRAPWDVRTVVARVRRSFGSEARPDSVI